MPTSQAKPFDIPKQLVWEAYRRVAANKGAPGVDEETLDEFESDLKNNLYKIWNRMSSGSYFPPPVQGGRDTKAARRRGPLARRTDSRRQGRPNGGGHVPGGEGRTTVPPRLLWLPPGEISPRRGRPRAGSGAGSSTG